MKYLIINTRRYILPEDATKLRKVLLHIDLCINGQKTHAKLLNIETNQYETVSSLELKNADLRFDMEAITYKLDITDTILDITHTTKTDSLHSALMICETKASKPIGVNSFLALLNFKPIKVDSTKFLITPIY